MNDNAAYCFFEAERSAFDGLKDLAGRHVQRFHIPPTQSPRHAITLSRPTPIPISPLHWIVHDIFWAFGQRFRTNGVSAGSPSGNPGSPKSGTKMVTWTEHSAVFKTGALTRITGLRIKNAGEASAFSAFFRFVLRWNKKLRRPPDAGSTAGPPDRRCRSQCRCGFPDATAPWGRSPDSVW